MKTLIHKIKNKIKYNRFFINYQSNRFAKTSKRLDICASQWASILHLAKYYDFRDKVCLEIGSGWVLSHALILYLLGAKKILATDIYPFAKPMNLKYAIKLSIHSLIRDVLAPFHDHSEIRKRLDNLMKQRHISLDFLYQLGIEYIAPIDLYNKPYKDKIDIIYSYSVLEHVPVNKINRLMRNAESMLTEKGVMFHCIHLEDHKDFANPFDFYKYNANIYHEEFQTKQGNRIRASVWQEIFNSLDSCEYNILWLWKRHDIDLPKKIDSSVQYVDEDDLRTSHIGVYLRKKERND